MVDRPFGYASRMEDVTLTRMQDRDVPSSISAAFNALVDEIAATLAETRQLPWDDMAEHGEDWAIGRPPEEPCRDDLRTDALRIIRIVARAIDPDATDSATVIFTRRPRPW
jgi:hypothetical protein